MSRHLLNITLKPLLILIKKALIGDFKVPPAGCVPNPDGASHHSTDSPDDCDDIGIPPAGWTPDSLDDRDYLYVPSAQNALKPLVDLRTSPYFGPVFGQGTIGSCTANAIASAFTMVLKKHKQDGYDSFIPSRLFIWYNEREMLSSDRVRRNSGARLRDGLKSIAVTGVCSEEDWPYEPCGFYDKSTNIFVDGARAATKLPVSAYGNALKHKAIQYMRIERDLKLLRACLDEGYPFVLCLGLGKRPRTQTW
jgi:C1A family cysteine protease